VLASGDSAALGESNALSLDAPVSDVDDTRSASKGDADFSLCSGAEAATFSKATDAAHPIYESQIQCHREEN
jgi:hypothetical protein